jgi:hypothetical protein
MHIQVNNLKVIPYWEIMTCKIQINHYIYTYIMKIDIVTPIVRQLSLHQLYNRVCAF